MESAKNHVHFFQKSNTGWTLYCVLIRNTITQMVRFCTRVKKKKECVQGHSYQEQTTEPCVREEVKYRQCHERKLGVSQEIRRKAT